MAIISEYEENEEIPKPKKPSSSSPPSSSSSKPSQFNASFDPSNPLGFLEKVFDFLAKESDFLSRDRVEKEIETVVRRAVEKRKKHAESVELKEKAGKKIKEEVRSVKQEPAPVTVKKEEARAVASPPEEKVDVNADEKKDENGPRCEYSFTVFPFFYLFVLRFVNLLCVLRIGCIDIVGGKTLNNIFLI